MGEAGQLAMVDIEVLDFDELHREAPVYVQRRQQKTQEVRWTGMSFERCQGRYRQKIARAMF
jgi:broad specificity phosphatase PhoE